MNKCLRLYEEEAEEDESVGGDRGPGVRGGPGHVMRRTRGGRYGRGRGIGRSSGKEEAARL